MRRILLRLWREEDAVTTPEWAFIATILVLGAITGMVASRRANVEPFEDSPAALRQR